MCACAQSFVGLLFHSRKTHSASNSWKTSRLFEWSRLPSERFTSHNVVTVKILFHELFFASRLLKKLKMFAGAFQLLLFCVFLRRIECEPNETSEDLLRFPNFSKTRINENYQAFMSSESCSKEFYSHRRCAMFYLIRKQALSTGSMLFDVLCFTRMWTGLEKTSQSQRENIVEKLCSLCPEWIRAWCELNNFIVTLNLFMI